jgi:predicted nuclease of predicted toxin-antitoxin system
VAEVATDAFGTGDSAVLERSVKEGRILVTNDKDFAELAFFRRSVASGIMLEANRTLAEQEIGGAEVIRETITAST